jgi:hypothetical protein
MISKGYVGLFRNGLHEVQIGGFVEGWLEGFDRVEQVIPGRGAGNATFVVSGREQVVWAPHLQFRVTSGEDFAWVYISMGRRVVETSGLPYGDNLVPLNVLAGLDGLEEVIDQGNERRLGELESEELM